MIIIGLTGGIGSGKSTVAKHFVKKKIPVFDSDTEVKKLYLKKEPSLIRVVRLIDTNKEIVIKKKINTKKLGDIVFNDHKKLLMLEGVIFKKLNKRRKIFLKKNKNKKIVVLDTPLLFEKKIDKLCDFTVVTKATQELRIKRLLKRRGMNRRKIRKIMNKQLPERIKQELADFIVHTSFGRWYSYKQVAAIISKISETR